MLPRSLFVTLAGLLILAASGGERASAEPLKFYGNASIPPMLSIDDGRPTGIVADIFAEVSRRTGTEISLTLMDWAEAQKLVKSGQGVGLVQLNRNADRETYLNFSEPLLTSEFVIFRRRADIHLQGLDSLAGKKVGVEGGGFPKSLIAGRPEIERRLLESWEEGFRLLSQGEIDAVIVDRWVGEYVLARANISGLVPSAQPLETLVSHIAVVKERPGLLAEVDTALREMREDGTFERILGKWQSSEIIYVTERENVLNNIILGLLGGGTVLALVLVQVVLRLNKTRRQLTIERQRLEDRVAERTAELNQKAEKELVLRKQAEKAERQARDLADAKTNFLATMSHELRTPLNAVIGFSEVLENKAYSKVDMETVQQYSRSISSSGRDLLSLINDILDFAKIEDGKFALHESPFNLEVEANNVRSAFLLRAVEYGVTLTTSFPDENVILNGDAMRLRQVVYNLVDNAIKFSKGGNVHLKFTSLKLEESKQQVVVTVEDNGIGIPEERMASIFDPFTQQDSSITRKYGGTGLGLSISRSLTHLMGGDLTVDSKLGEGSTFSATFVFDDLTEISAAMQGLDGGSGAILSRKYGLDVLAVDDVAANLDVLSVMLEHLGCTLHGFTDPETAIAWSKSNRSDIVLMDIHMPTLDGVETARRIKRFAEGYGDTPFFAWTADINVMRDSNAPDLYWDGVILKPTSHDDIVMNLKALAAR